MIRHLPGSINFQNFLRKNLGRRQELTIIETENKNYSNNLTKTTCKLIVDKEVLGTYEYYTNGRRAYSGKILKKGLIGEEKIRLAYDSERDKLKRMDTHREIKENEFP